MHLERPKDTCSQATDMGIMPDNCGWHPWLPSVSNAVNINHASGYWVGRDWPERRVAVPVRAALLEHLKPLLGIITTLSSENVLLATHLARPIPASGIAGRIMSRVQG